METKVVSLGGSLIIPEIIDYEFIKKFRTFLLNESKKYKFVIVCGGGKTARNYINPLLKEKIDYKICSLMGIRVTRLNAWFMINFFRGKANKTLPKSIKDVQNLLKKGNIVFAGALRYEPNNTSDGTAAKIAAHLNADFINMTDVKGLYTKNPKVFKDAKFIPRISFNAFYKRANAIKYKAGMHFVLDQSASRIIRQHNIKTIIISKDLKNFKNYLDKKPFVGTIISG